MTQMFSRATPWLAPLAGYSDIAFRLLCREYGASVTCTEMISVKGLSYKSKGTEELLTTHEKDSPLVVQLFGREPELLRNTIAVLKEQGFIYFDLNVGCSVHKVAKTGCGSALMREPEMLKEVAQAMVEEASVGCVGFKIRLGWNEQEENYCDIGKMLEGVGAGWITLHPRYAKQGYSGIANWDAIETLVNAVSIPIIASGDLFSAQDGYACVQQTGASTVMFARGAMRIPYIFDAYKALCLGKELPSYNMCTIAIEHIRLLQKYVPERRAVARLRSIVPRYIKGIPGASALRPTINSITSFEDFIDVILSLSV